MSIEIWDADTWPAWMFVAWPVGIIAGLELLAWLVLQLEPFFNTLEARGKPLDTLTNLDWAFVAFNKLSTSVFTYHLLRYCAVSGKVDWDLSHLDVTVMGQVAALFVVYDFFYTLFHMFLHQRGIYKWVHKHHHRQMVPIRGNVDAVNVHPFEFVPGEYNHLLATFIVSQFLPLHMAAVAVFIIVGGALASLNHTRFDLMVGPLYTVRAHDLHHHIPNKNYGQYIMLWDYLFGSFREYDPKSKTKKAS
eukprot:TRINITY_DN11869_c4_g5_i1.p1 TRINITY_DN11869_c4_g5~~TRINITY_DN11869_c4_g5_i1.p1  ORF type:complete len:284 (+),score=42.78 TRINITY_DN11869_c4_g5_i1:110-853(+)